MNKELIDMDLLATKLLSCDETIDQDNKNAYRIKKCRMKKELEELLYGDYLSKNEKKLLSNIFEVCIQIQEPERLRIKLKQKEQQHRILQEKLSLAEAYYTDKAMEKLKKQQNQQKCELAQSLDVSRERNRRLATQLEMLQSKIEDIRDNYKIVSHNDWDTMVNTNTINVKKINNNEDDEIKKLKKENKKLKKQIQSLMTVDDSSSDDDSD